MASQRSPQLAQRFRQMARRSRFCARWRLLASSRRACSLMAASKLSPHTRSSSLVIFQRRGTSTCPILHNTSSTTLSVRLACLIRSRYPRGEAHRHANTRATNASRLSRSFGRRRISATIAAAIAARSPRMDITLIPVMVVPTRCWTGAHQPPVTARHPTHWADTFRRSSGWGAVVRLGVP